MIYSDLTWRRLIFGMSDGKLHFSLQAITNTTPTPDNLRRWGNSEIDSACSICGQTCTLRHVLNACKVSLLQGRYLWRHNLILGCLQKYLLDFWSSVKKENCAATAPFTRLIPEGTKAINLPSSYLFIYLVYTIYLIVWTALFDKRSLPWRSVAEASLVNHERFPGRDVLKSTLLNGQT